MTCDIEGCYREEDVKIDADDGHDRVKKNVCSICNRAMHFRAGLEQSSIVEENIKPEADTDATVSELEDAIEKLQPAKPDQVKKEADTQ